MSGRRHFLQEFLSSAAAFVATAACNPDKLFGRREPERIGRAFFGHMVDGGLVNADGSTSTPITIPIGTLRGWNLGASLEWVSRNNWEGFDQMMLLGEQLGAEIIYVLAGEATTSLPPLEEWRAFVRAAVERSAGRIRHWEVWNEPVYCKGATPADMALFAREAYTIIKAAYPWATVLSPSFNDLTASYARAYAVEYFKAPHYEDAIAFHSYDPIARLPEVVRILRGLSDLPLWNTETASEDPFVTLVSNASFGVQRCVWNAQIEGCRDYSATEGLGLSYMRAFDSLVTRAQLERAA